jgi:hypothetical protein
VVTKTYPPISDAIPKLTESVIVQFPINQIHPVIYASGILPVCASSALKGLSASGYIYSKSFDQGHTVAPVAGTSRRRVSRSKFAQRERYTLVEDKYDYPSQEHTELPATVDRGDQRRSFSIWYCCDGERLEKQCPKTAVSRELFFVSEHGKRFAFLEADSALIWACAAEFFPP